MERKADRFPGPLQDVRPLYQRGRRTQCGPDPDGSVPEGRPILRRPMDVSGLCPRTRRNATAGTTLETRIGDEARCARLSFPR
ncbi:hypothetical protein MEX01_20890 [Methylorubrum extorquens]|nr:hypothetical protein MEX01_20890 [Methylorubrum extorquens]